MMKVLNLSLIAVILSTTACAASPEDVCKKQVELVKKAGIPVSDEELKECVSSMTSKKEMKGYFSYRTFAGCIMDAESLTDAEKCK